MEGKKNRDLWVDEKLYVKRPFLKLHTPTQGYDIFVLNFVRDGYNGFLRYTHYLEATNNVIKLEIDLFEKNIYLKQSMKQCAEAIEQQETILGLKK